MGVALRAAPVRDPDRAVLVAEVVPVPVGLTAAESALAARVGPAQAPVAAVEAGTEPVQSDPVAEIAGIPEVTAGVMPGASTTVVRRGAGR